MFFLDSNNLKDLNAYLQKQQWLAVGEEIISATKPGEGNMNYVLRITTTKQSFIIKQARPYVEKYPQVAAPVERALVEAAFYKTIQDDGLLSNYMPKLIGVDALSSIIILEDLGQSNDYSYLYKTQEKLQLNETEQLVAFLNQLHQQPTNSNPLLQNNAMRQLNHQHIFLLPFIEANGFDLDTVQLGLQALSMPYKTDIALKDIIKNIGKKYLDNGTTLLHGDYYPGSWLNTNNGIKIIDPEFCFYGAAEFDVAVMIAHCIMTFQSDDILKIINIAYQKSNSFNNGLLNQFTGIEIMRRVIGLAQLPLQLSLQQKEDLLQKAYNLITNN